MKNTILKWIPVIGVILITAGIVLLLFAIWKYQILILWQLIFTIAVIVFILKIIEWILEDDEA